LELDLYPHQRAALEKLANGKILRGGVGSGKTRVAAAYYLVREAPKDVYVITTAKKRDSFDWQNEFYRIGIGPRTGPFVLPTGSNHSENGSAGAVGRETSQSNRGSKQPAYDGLHGSCSTAGRARSGGIRVSGTDFGASNRDLGNGRFGTSEVASQGSDRWGDGNRLAREPDQGRIDSQHQDLNKVFDKCGYPDVSGPPRPDQDREGWSIGDRGSYPYVLIVDSWNNIAKYADVAGAFFIFDEQRLVGSGDWTRKFLRIAKHNNWILLTATPGDTWMDYVPVFVANNFYKNRTAFKREHVVYNTFTKFPKVDRYIGVGKLLRQRAQLLVEMPYERHTKRRVVQVPLDYDKEALERVLTKRWHIYENRPLRDVAEMFSVGRRVVNSDPSRLEKVVELWKKHPKLIIFYNFNYELNTLRSLSSLFLSMMSQTDTDSRSSSMFETDLSQLQTNTLLEPVGLRSPSMKITRTDPLPSKKSNHLTGSLLSPSAGLNISSNCHDIDLDSVIAEWNGHKHEPIPSTNRWLYLVQYTAGAEGWNCIETDATVMYSRHYSWRVTEQARGRIDRMNTPFNELWYYDFTSDSFIDRAIGRALKAKKTFNESRYKGLFES
jgi:hypothetical protein